MSGTYIALGLTGYSASLLHMRLHLMDIPFLGNASNFHTTIISSTTEIPRDQFRVPGEEGLPILASIREWKIFETSQDPDNVDKCLVACLDCPEFMALHKQAVELGGTHLFDSYEPHLTVSYKFNKKFNMSRLPIGLNLTFDPKPIIEDLIQ